MTDPPNSMLLRQQARLAEARRKPRPLKQYQRRCALHSELAGEVPLARPDDDAEGVVAGRADRTVAEQAHRGVPYERQSTPDGLGRRSCSSRLDAREPHTPYVDQPGQSPRMVLEVHYRATDRRGQSQAVVGARNCTSTKVGIPIGEPPSLHRRLR